MEVSIILPSFKRADLLSWGLCSLSRQQRIHECEILVMNDGLRDSTEDVCRNYGRSMNIHYIFTGSRNDSGEKWRIPGYCINIGVKQSTSELIILSCPEMFLVESDIVSVMIDKAKENPKALVITEGKDDIRKAYLEHITATKTHSEEIYRTMAGLCTDYPFFMCLHKKEFVDIGGYDEDFTGKAYDDTDLVRRLLRNGCSYIKLPRKIVHLYHPRSHNSVAFEKNKKMFFEREGMITRNVGREWGVLC